MEDNILILPVNSSTFQVENYSTEDSSLISQVEIDTKFTQSSDYIEYYIYDGNQNLIFPSTTEELLTYNIKDGHIFIDPKQDLERLDFNEGDYFINYNFYRNHLNSNIQDNYYIEEISSDRKEIRLNSTTIIESAVSSSTNEFILYRENKDYFVDFYLNFGKNNLVLANNIKLDQIKGNEFSTLIKLYEPLPPNIDLKSKCWVVEKISQPQSYQVKFPIPIFEPQDFEFIAGPNLSLNIKDESGVSSKEYSYDTLINSSITSSTSQIQSLLNEKGIKININYEDFSKFVNFSSAQVRIENFYHKVGLIERYTNQISLLDTGVSDITTVEFSSSKTNFETQINNITDNFDPYEYFLYYNSGSDYSYPKLNSTPPYNLYSTSSDTVIEWLGSSDITKPNYGGILLTASIYDENNQNYLKNTIPEYLRDDPNNSQYGLFVDMVSQHFDSIWVYTKDIVNKFNADNRLNYGISKDLVADSIRDFGIKLYSNNFNTNDLYKAFLGITPSGGTFPYENSMDYFPVSPGSEYIDTKISASNDIIPLDDVNKRLYKRIYHNIPYLLKTKGTIAGLRALITSYGIPDTILKINEFGGKNNKSTQVWDYKENLFNYSLDLDGSNYFSSSFEPNSLFTTTKPNTVQLRFKTPGIPSQHLSQSIFSIEGASLLTIEYTGSSYISGSFSGSITDPYNEYGTIKYIPDVTTPSSYLSAYLPVFNGGWWSIMTNTTSTASLTVANSINDEIGFIEHNSIEGVNNILYNNSEKILIPSDQNISVLGKNYTPLSGSIQEVRYYSSNISTSSFKDFTLNPVSIKGTDFNTSEELIFRADLGTLSFNSNRNSIHPKVTGSWVPTSSFNGGDSSFYINEETFIPNKEYAYQNQPFQGIKNKINSRINIFENIIPEGNTLSSERSIQQYSYTTQSTTPDADYLEVAFSPSNQINDDIVAELGNFNLGEYIGDPRILSSQKGSYPSLDILRDSYFNKYKNSYNIKDFIRLIKFFDNSLFKMIKDFTPSRTNLTSGVVVKQHILERSVYKPVLPSFSDVTLSGSVKSFPRGYNTGSGDVGQPNYENGSSIYTVNGGTVGAFERYNGLSSSPSGSDGNGPNNIFNLTQSWDENSPSILGDPKYRRDDQREFYNGEFSQSSHVKMQRGLNIGNDDPCYPYTNWENVPELLYRLEFLSGSDELFRIEEYTPPVPLTGILYERSDIDTSLPIPINPIAQCINISDESIYFVEQNINSIGVGSIAYTSDTATQTFDGSHQVNNTPLYWGIKPPGYEYNLKSLLINQNGEVLEQSICRIPNDNIFYFTSGSTSPTNCYTYTVGNFNLDIPNMSYTYTSCSGVSFSETLEPFENVNICVLSGSTITTQNDSGFVYGGITVCGSSGDTDGLITSASLGLTLETAPNFTYTLSEETGCWDFSSSAFVPPLELPTQTVTGICGIEPPSIVITNVKYSQYQASTACSTYSIIRYSDSQYLNLSTVLYVNPSGTYLAPSGYYSNGVIVRYWDASSSTLGSIVSCTSGGSTGGGGGGCHVAGELITLADGQTKLVEDIVVGDSLLSIDFEGLNISGEYKDWKKTEETLVSEYTSTVVTKVTVLDFFRYFNINNGLLKITEEHPVLIKDTLGDIYFKQVRDIVINDSLLNENNVWIKIDSVELVTVPEKFTTYSLDVEESDVYFANNIVVHNVELDRDDKGLGSDLENDNVYSD